MVEGDVDWPLDDGAPLFAEAFVDRGGTDLCGPGPYLEVPNRRDTADGAKTAVNARRPRDGRWALVLVPAAPSST